MEEDYACQYARLKPFDGKLIHLEEWIYAIWQNWSEITQKRIFKIKKRDNTIVKLSQKTQELSISPKSDKFGQDLQNHKWPEKLKRQLEDSTFKDKLPNISYKPINTNKETFQILVDGNEKIYGDTLKTKPKKNKVRFSENHELSDGENINEIEKDLIIMEERKENSKETYHINFLDRPLNSQEEPYEWQLENPEFIQKPPNEEEETEYNYLYFTYINFEDM
ncbi:hypothetical protein O181_080003 [Austropuccinia psidii MF-1]|uniref:Uncharacterized protein n=1 Tax=Austropuccinia psidii MF-1 TaxID=1389203 RepID=A0A9Q3FHV2_9BASI|nr:hypothetical protein [Austropuccinia psidii MF-1]